MKIGFTFLDLWYFMDDSDWIKPHLFFFDKIIVDRGKLELTERLIPPVAKFQSLFKEKIKEVELLDKKGLIEVFDKDKFKYSDRLLEDSVIRDNLRLHVKHYKKITEFNKPTNLPDLYVNFMEEDRAGGQYGIRYKSAILNKLNLEDEYIPIIKKLYESDNEVKKENVLQILFKKMPVIDDNVEIEKLLEIKHDTDFKIRYYALRDFITQISKSSLSLKEIEDKIDYLLLQYTDSLKMHKLKYTYSMTEIICISTTKFLEDILKFKFSDAIKLLFEIKKKELAVIDAEKLLPGRELSYLHLINQKMGI